ncbi:MAG TPA: hypothetical protein VJ865_06490, partial [Gemmatimonadaceae bacterium]|nr:hypothetical protein [Gemmatimonadaceae bacterium]
MKRLILLLLLVLPSVATARVVRVEILSRSPVSGDFAGHTYERITGRVYFAFDPHNPQNRKIVHLDLAPRNSMGEVEAVSEFVMLRPTNLMQPADEVAVIDIVNRGGITHFVFNLGRNVRASPESKEFYGDALLMNRGVTIVAIAWQWDVLPGGSALQFQAPPVGSAAHPITGIVRSDITIDSSRNWIPLGHSLGGGALGYPVADPNDRANRLTVRDSPTGARSTVPRREWRFARAVDGNVVDDLRSVYMAKGFQPGKIYEVIYRAGDPVVVGAGMAAVRDMISYLKYDA